MMFVTACLVALLCATSALDFNPKNGGRALLTQRELLSRGKKGGKRGKNKCSEYLDDCDSSEDCCGCLECHYGWCLQPCVQKGHYCDEFNYCCEGLYCYAWECTDRVPCYPVHYECEKDRDCCEGLECTHGYCYLPCKGENEFCDDYWHYCCDGYECKDYCCQKEKRRG